jgi:hypothetical protein
VLAAGDTVIVRRTSAAVAPRVTAGAWVICHATVITVVVRVTLARAIGVSVGV